MSEDIFDDLDSDFLPDEHELRKEIAKLKRDIKRLEEDHKRKLITLERAHKVNLANHRQWDQDEVSTLRVQVQQLVEKNIEMSEMSKVFAKGIEHLKKEGIRVTKTCTWERRGVHGTLEATIARLSMSGSRIVSMCPLFTNQRGEVLKVFIVTEHLEKVKRI